MTRNFVIESKLNFQFKGICKCLFNRGKPGVQSLGPGVFKSNTFVDTCFFRLPLFSYLTVCPLPELKCSQLLMQILHCFQRKLFVSFAPFCLKWKFKIQKLELKSFCEKIYKVAILNNQHHDHNHHNQCNYQHDNQMIISALMKMIIKR